MYLFWSVAIVLCLMLVLFSLLFASCAKYDKPADITDNPGSEISDIHGKQGNKGMAGLPVAGGKRTAPPTPPADTTVLAETADAGQDYLDRLTFLGDSTTYGLKYHGLLSGGKDTKQVWTPKSGTLALFNRTTALIVYPETGEEISIVDAVTLKKPEYLVITLGVNGVASMDEEYFKAEYTALIKSVLEASPDTKIICNSIYPVCNSYSQLKYINNTNISAANEWIKAVAEETGTKYCDSASVLVGEDGALPEDYDVDDGIHLNAEAFKLVLNYMRTHAWL